MSVQAIGEAIRREEDPRLLRAAGDATRRAAMCCARRTRMLSSAPST
jgi:hypothetical protein